MASINAPRFQDANEARKYLESIRWPEGPVCPHCGTVNDAYQTKRPGLYRCSSKGCRKDFSVTVGTVYERSHIPLNKWLLATYLLCSSKKGISSHQLHRMLGVTYKSAWFMTHRIREAMAPHGGSLPPLGGEGKTVEADETYIGGKEKNKHRSKRNSKNLGGMGKQIAFTLVERNGKARTQHIAAISGKTIRPILVAQLESGTFLMTDEAGQYLRTPFRHETVNHGIGEYVRGEAHTNTVESYFATLKRGITGVYHHVSQQHLKRYLAEFDFRHNERSALGIDDTTRADRVLKAIEGKRLTYRRPDSREVVA